MMSDAESCNGCRYLFEQVDPTNVGKRRRGCRRYPPQVSSHPIVGPSGERGTLAITNFPDALARCGEYNPRVDIDDVDTEHEETEATSYVDPSPNDDSKRASSGDSAEPEGYDPPEPVQTFDKE